jgi:hypothetical protein
VKTPEQVSQKVRASLTRNWKRFLSDSVAGTPFELRIPIGFDRKSAAEDFSAFEKHWKQWRLETSAFQGKGIELQTKRVRWSGVGGEREILDAVAFRDRRAVLSFLKDVELLRRWVRSVRRLRYVRTKKPETFERLLGEPQLISNESGTEFKQLIRLVDYLEVHRTADCYIRELPVSGVNTKFFERNLKLISDLLSVRLGKTLTPEILITEWNIKLSPFLVNVCNPDVFLEGMPKTELAAIGLSALKKRPSALLVIENLQTGLAISSAVPGIPVVCGMGFGATRLAELPWIKEVPIYYFGDLDVHGLAILSVFRKVAPQTTSFLMDRKTFQRYGLFSVKDPTKPPFSTAPIGLTDEEAFLYETLLRTGQRLEQERIPLDFVFSELKKCIN